MAISCHECKKKLSRGEWIEINKHYYCKDCERTVRHRNQFSKYVCWLFGIKAPGPILWSQRKAFMTKYGYTDEGICNTLKYLYEVKQQQRLPVTLGLVPSNYEEAAAYFKKISEDRRKFNEQLQYLIDNPSLERPVDLAKIRSSETQGGPKQIDLNTLFD